MVILQTPQPFESWNKGKLVGQKAPLKLKDIWAIRIRLQLGHKIRDLALFNLVIDSKLRACDLVKLRVSDVSHGGQIASRAIVLQQKTGRPVQFEITQSTREAIQAWIAYVDLKVSDFLFRSRVAESPHLSTRQHAWIVHRWVKDAGLESGSYGTQDQSFIDLPTHAKPSGRSALAWAYEAGEHRSLSGHRRGGCLGDRRAD